MKRIKIFFGAVLMTALLVGCGSRSLMPKGDRFDVVEEYSDCYIIVDKETGIGYLRYGYGNGGGVSPLYDADGELYRPNGWRDYGE